MLARRWRGDSIRAELTPSHGDSSCQRLLLRSHGFLIEHPTLRGGSWQGREHGSDEKGPRCQFHKTVKL